MSSRTTFTTIRTEGALLPPDILTRIAAADRDLGGLTEASYHLSGEKFGEATSRAWNRLQSAWVGFQSARQSLPTGDVGTTITRERWLLPLFQLLDFGRLQIAKSQEIGGKTYAISHGWQHVPIHLTGFRVDLDTRANKSSSPHSLLQEFLNRSGDHLWGIVSNGLRLRLLRDNISLTRRAYVEFDLEAMMSGEAYSDFVLLWLLLHQSRFEGERPELAWIEKWSQAARTEGVRVLDGLSDGVQQAIEALGQGALSHPANGALFEALKNGALAKQDYYRELLRLVYRLLFLFVAEDRELLLDPNAAPEARARYNRHYATTRIRLLAVQRIGSRHDDLYRVVKLVMNKLAANGCPELALPALGSFLFSSRSTPHLDGCEIPNRFLLRAFRSLAVTQTKQGRRTVDYKNLGAEELGSVYESLLELHPIVDVAAGSFDLKSAIGSERKKTGSYYTPSSLISSLLDSALDPALKDAMRHTDAERRILKLKILDPACGSGHFLIAAAHRIARVLSALRTGDEEPSPEAERKALRDVIGRCVYGVDINPMAVELCKVSLWMEAIEPSKPLSFLDHHIRVGNSLLGATPELIAAGIPEAAFIAIEGDDKKACTVLKKRNSAQSAQPGLLLAQQYTDIQARLERAAAALDDLPDDRPEEIRQKELAFRGREQTQEYRDKIRIADAWCAAFVIRKYFLEPGRERSARGITQSDLHRLADGQTILPALSDAIDLCSQQYQFFHWHLAFPEVFGQGGFDCVLGNPPWEKVELLQREWFAVVKPDLKTIPAGKEKNVLFEQLKASDPELYEAFIEATRASDAERSFIQHSGRFPLCGRGRINSYAAFAETNLQILAPDGLAGCVLPPGIGTDDSTKFFIQNVVENQSLKCFYAFTNRGYIFPDIESTLSFALVTYGRRKSESLQLAAQLWQVEHLTDEGRVYVLDRETIRRINPNTLNLPILQSAKDALLVSDIHRRIPILQDDNRTGDQILRTDFRQGLFNMTTDKMRFESLESMQAKGCAQEGNAFSSGEKMRFLPLYEAKLTSQFNHRHGTFDGVPESERFGTRAQTNKPRLDDLKNPNWTVLPRYWVNEKDVNHAVPEDWNRRWFLGFRNAISAVADFRSVSFSAIPWTAVGNSMPLLFCYGDPCLSALLLANFNAFVLDYVCRQKASGGNLNFYVLKQLPILASCYTDTFTWLDGQQKLWNWLLPRVVELTYTAWDLKSFAEDCGWTCPPFRWDEERRFQLRCEIDAVFFRLYLPAQADGHWWPTLEANATDQMHLATAFATPRDAVAYIMETFPVVRRRDEETWKEYRTKRVILEIYDAMATAERAGGTYQTRLTPPPADPRIAHTPTMATPSEMGSIPPLMVPSLDFVADRAWATPPGIQPDNFVLLVVTEVLHRLKPQVDPHRVWQASRFVRNPAVALAFLDKTEMKDWARIIGSEAQPVPRNVVDMSSFRRGTPDQLWGDVILGMKAVGSLVESGGLWSVTAKALAPADDEWLAGRAEIAVRLAVKLVDEGETELRLAEFLRSVQDGTAKRAVS